MPSSANVTALRSDRSISTGTIVLNVVAIALWTVGVFASLYAGYLNPQLRGTSATLSSMVNGLATILMFVIIDPQLSVMTDDVIEGRQSESSFRRTIVWLVGSRLAGNCPCSTHLVSPPPASSSSSRSGCDMLKPHKIFFLMLTALILFLMVACPPLHDSKRRTLAQRHYNDSPNADTQREIEEAKHLDRRDIMIFECVMFGIFGASVFAFVRTGRVIKNTTA